MNLNIWHVNNNRRPLIFLHANWTKPSLAIYPRHVCLSPMMPRDGGAKPSTKRRKSWPIFFCHETVARKRLATGWTIHFTSWLTLVKLECSSFRESHVKSDQSVSSKRQTNSWKKRKPTISLIMNTHSTTWCFVKYRGSLLPGKFWGKIWIMNYKNPFQWSLPITRSAAV